MICSTLCLAALGAAVPAPVPNQAVRPPGTERAAIVCRLDALDAAERRRQQELRARLDEAVSETRELDDGWSFRLGEDVALLMASAEWAALEARCCPFLDVAVAWRGGEVWLTLTGAEGVKQFLAGELARG